jgi:putative FmdB family regulatory protein
VTYLYECGSCGLQVEKEQRITAAPIRKCPGCRAYRLRRLIAGAGTFVLNGTGWFNTGGY